MQVSQFYSMEERAHRHREMKRAIEPYQQKISYLISIAPMTGFEIDKEGNFIRQLPLEQKYQDAIDRAKNEMMDFIEKEYPEFRDGFIDQQ